MSGPCNQHEPVARDAAAESAWNKLFQGRVAHAEMIYRMRADILAAGEAVRDKDTDFVLGFKRGWDECIKHHCPEGRQSTVTEEK